MKLLNRNFLYQFFFILVIIFSSITCQKNAGIIQRKINTIVFLSNRDAPKRESVDFHASIWLNGEFVAEHSGGYLPFEFDVPDYILKENDNHLIAFVRITGCPMIQSPRA